MKYRNLPQTQFSSPLFNSIFDDFLPELSKTRVNGDLNMYQEGDDLFVKIEAPGFKEEDIQISLDNGILTIEGNHSVEKEEENKHKKYYFKEIKKESFQRSIQLPNNIDQESFDADYKNGIISIKMTLKNDSNKKIISLKKG